VGVEISRLVGLCFGILVTDETRPAFAVFLEKVFTVPAKGACEVALQKDGCDPLCVQVEGMATDSGQECRIAMIDITERKLAEEAISASNKLLQTIINTTPIGVFWKDTELRYLGSNIIFARDAGVAFPDDLIGKDDYQLGWEEQAESYRADDRHVIASGIPKLSYDQLQYTPDGDQIWLRTSKVPLRNDAKETIGVLGIYEDITDRKLAEIARTRLLLRQRAILDNLPMMAWLKDTEGRLEMVNEPYAKACGHSVEECIGKTVLELFPEEIARGYVTDDHEVCSTGRKKLVEESISTLQGTKWQCAGRPARSKGESPLQ
jgi:PAS domain S-box-containing protein